MALKNLDTLTNEINQAVQPHGGGPKVTGPALNAVLRSLAAELTALPQAPEGAAPATSPAVVLAPTLAGLPPAGQAGVLYVLTAVEAATSPVLYRWAGGPGQYVPVLPASAGARPVRVREAFGASQPITFDQDTDFENSDGSPLTDGFDAAGSAGAFSFAGAVRGTTVRVPYYSGTPFRLPASFNLLTGPLPTDNVKTILYFRYVRDNVVDVTAGTSQPGTYLARFWAMPGAADLGLGLYMAPDTQVLAVSSEGRKVRSGAFNGGGPGVHFDDASGRRYVDLFTYAGSPVLAHLAGNFAGIGPVYGELNLDVLPDLGGFCNLQFTRGYTKVIAHKPDLDLLIAFRYEGTVLDLSACVASRINAWSSYCTSVVLPPANEHLTFLHLGEHRLYNQSLTFPSLPNLGYLDLTTGQHHAGRLDQVDITLLPGLGELYTQQSALRTLVIGDNPLSHLSTAYFYMGRLTGRPEPFGQGHFATVVQLAERAHQLTNFNLGFNGLSEAEIDQVASALVAALPAAVAGPKQLNLADYPGETTFRFGDNGYPNPYNHDPDFGFAYNAPVVSTATLAKLAQLQAGGWQVTYNENIPLYLTYLSPTTFRGTYQGPAAIDRWAVGEELALQSSDGRFVPDGSYRVVGGGGRVWEFALLEGQPPLPAFGEGMWVATRPPVR
jgi:hypothetical protein